MDSGGITLAERQIAVEAGVWLASVVGPRLETDADGQVWDGYVSTIQNAAAGLVALGLLISDDGQAPWRLVVEWREARGFLEPGSRIDRRAFETVMKGFIDFAASHEACLPDTRAGFHLPDDLAPLGRALEHGGYLRRDRDKVLWTDRVGHHMQAAFCWDENGRCLTEIWAAGEEAEARAFLATLPEWLIVDLRKVVQTRGRMAGIEHLKRHWSPNGWIRISQTEPLGLPGTVATRTDLLFKAFSLMRAGKA